MIYDVYLYIVTIIVASDILEFVYIYVYIYIYIVIVVIFIWWSPFIPFRNIDEVSLITIYGSNVPSKPLSC